MLGIDIQQILLHLLNFTILFTGLYVLLYGPVKKFMESRQEEYKKQDEESSEKLANAEKLEAEYKQKLADADNEIAEKKRAMAKEMSAAREQSEAEAKQEAVSIINAAKKSAELEKAEILETAKGEITRLIEDAAQKMILSGSTSEVYDKFLEGAERSIEDGTGA